jgi:hypothetical protein
MGLLQIPEHFLLGHTFMCGDQSDDGTERSNAQNVMIRNRQSLMPGGSGLEDHVASHLMDNAIIPALAQVPDERRTRQVSRKLHASGQGEALVTNQM